MFYVHGYLSGALNISVLVITFQNYHGLKILYLNLWDVLTVLLHFIISAGLFWIITSSIYFPIALVAIALAQQNCYSFKESRLFTFLLWKWPLVDGLFKKVIHDLDNKIILNAPIECDFVV